MSKRFLVASQGVVKHADDERLALGNYFAIFAALIAIQYFFYAHSFWPLRPPCRMSGNPLAKLTVPRWFAVADVILVRIGRLF